MFASTRIVLYLTFACVCLYGYATVYKPDAGENYRRIGNLMGDELFYTAENTNRGIVRRRLTDKANRCRSPFEEIPVQ